MRLINTFILLILLLLSISARAQKLNIVHKEMILTQFFKELRKQTGYNIVWNEKQLNADQVIDANFQNIDLKEVLDYVSTKLSLTYNFTGKTIILKQAGLQKKVVNQRGRSLEGANLARQNEDKAVITLQEVEIVSTGYQNIPERQATGSFVLIDSGQLDRRVSSDIFSRLEGVASGLLFNKNTISTNSGNLDLSIRGRSTIFANDQPLIVIDNFPFNGDFNSLNPNDVASITLLKDAAAAAIWGVRAGNGVIVIKTKRGKYDQPLNITLNTNLTVAARPDVFYNPNYLSSSDYIDIETFLFNQGKYDEALTDQVNYPVISPVVQILNRQRMGLSAEEAKQQLDALRGNDIRNEELKYFYRTPVSQQYALSLSGGTNKYNHYFSAGYDKKLPDLINNDNNRITINSQQTFKLVKNLELNAAVYYIQSASRSDSTINEMSGINFLPYYKFKDQNGNPSVFDKDYSADFKDEALGRGFQDWTYVPLNELGQSPLKMKSNNLRLDGGLKYTIVAGLSAEIKYQYQHLNNRSELYNGIENYQTRNLINRFAIVTDGQVSGYNIPLGGIFYEDKEKAVSNSLRGQLSYQNNWLKHSFSAIAGYEVSEYDSDASSNTYYGYDTKSGTSLSVDTASLFNLNPSGSASIGTSYPKFGNLDRIRSAYANLTYTYDTKYTLSGSARMDGSNYFGVKTNQKNVPLWSMAGLWNLGAEPFYSLSWMPDLRLRASYGYNGNLDKRNTGITTFRYNLLGSAFTNLPFAGIINIGNPELRWEKIGIANFGVDFGFKNQVLTGKIEYYIKNGTDILGDKAFPSNTGINTLRGNYSKMKARGIDMSLTHRNLSGKVSWITNFLFSAVNDKVTSYDVVEPNSVYYVGVYSERPVLGKPVYGIYSYKWAGLDPLNGDPMGYLNGEISKDYSAIVNTTTTEDLEYHGSARPTIFGGLNNTFSFNKFTMGFNISYKMGYYFRKNSVNYYSMYNHGLGENMNSDFVQRWQKSGDEDFTNIPSKGTYAGDNLRDVFYNGSSATVARGDHIRLQDVSLSFNLDRSNWRKIPVKQMQLYFYANNLSIIWKANDFELDPDVVPGIGDRLSYPAGRSFAFGLKASF